MWKWSCPDDPGYIREHHSEALADEAAWAHENGYFGLVPNAKPCPHVHDVVDDGIPCQRPGGCNLKYDRTPLVD